MKERRYCFIHSLKHDFDTFGGDATNCLVRDLKSLSITCCFHFSPFRVLFFLTHYSAYCFLCIYECTTPVINFFVDHNVWEYACFKMAQDRTPSAALELLHPLTLYFYMLIYTYVLSVSICLKV